METPDAADLPFDWYNGNITPEEVRMFVKAVFGADMSEDYSFTIEREWGSLSVTNGVLENSFDGQTIQVVGGATYFDDTVETEGDEAIVGVLYTTYDPEQEEHSVVITCVPSGNLDIFGGLQIKSF
ncbi:MAG: hypothetical protein J1E03_04430 [Acetatifactor sp.]|nr:hypothetical protein [Acetatifactor sp.]